MRQLKGKPKENAKEKKERKKEFAENREKAFSIGDNPFSYSSVWIEHPSYNHVFSALPVLGACFVLLVMLVYSATRPKTIPMDQEMWMKNCDIGPPDYYGRGGGVEKVLL